jgi:hypothetical protein
MAEDLRRKDPTQKSRQRLYYSSYYSTHFLKLRKYVIKGKIKGGFKEVNFRDWLRDDGVDKSKSKHARTSLNFFCREDMGLCTYDKISKRYMPNVDAREFRTKNFRDLQTYIEYKGIDYIEPKGKPDRRTLNDRLGGLPGQPKHENNTDLEQKVSLGKSMMHEFEKRVSNC